MAPKLEYFFTMRGYISKENTVDLKTIKDGPSRIIVPIMSGSLTGSGLKAEILPGGSDWILLDPSSNVAHIDVRTHASTANGEAVFVHYHGVLKIDEATQKCLSWSKDAKSTAYGDHEWFNAPQMETSSKEFKWVETSIWVGQGHWIVEGDKTAVEYEIYRVVN